MMTRPFRLLQAPQHLQPLLELLCHSTAIRLPHPLTVLSHPHLQDWDSQPLDLSHPGAPAASLSHLTGSLLPTSARHSDAQHFPALLPTQHSHFRHSLSCRHSLLWSLTLGQTH